MSPLSQMSNQPKQYEYEWYKIEEMAATKIQAKYRMLKVIHSLDPVIAKDIRLFKPLRLISSSDLQPGCNYLPETFIDNVAEIGLCCSPTQTAAYESESNNDAVKFDFQSPIGQKATIDTSRLNSSITGNDNTHVNLYKTYSTTLGEAMSAMDFGSFEVDDSGRHSFTLGNEFVEDEEEIEVLVGDEDE